MQDSSLGEVVQVHRRQVIGVFDASQPVQKIRSGRRPTAEGRIGRKGGEIGRVFARGDNKKWVMRWASGEETV